MDMVDWYVIDSNSLHSEFIIITDRVHILIEFKTKSIEYEIASTSQLRKALNGILISDDNVVHLDERVISVR